jgi:hypothetical protein
MRGQSAGLLNVKADGAYCYHCPSYVKRCFAASPGYVSGIERLQIGMYGQVFYPIRLGLPHFDLKKAAGRTSETLHC